jgi:hypothetical protein
MAKATRNGQAAAVKRQGRRVMPKVQARRTAVAARPVRLTLGDLVAAAFEAAGNEVRGAARILSSNDVACAIQKRIVLV